MLNLMYARTSVSYCPAVERDKIVMSHEIATFAQSLITTASDVLLFLKNTWFICS